MNAFLRRPGLRVCLALLLLFFSCGSAGAYSVLSHEEVVDMAWLTTIVPMLHTRFPALTDDQIITAHAYAYGGSVIQDLGYYPFGNPYFSDLLHYVRTGDFVAALIRESTNPNEYAFALGALAHYSGDVYGHPAVNIATALEFPKLGREFGRSVTYDENKTAHLRTEFGFDVAEVAHGRYSQKNYRDFIGFQVAKPLLERAFLETYGIPMDSVMKHEDLAISTYRKAVSTIIPHMTEIALVSYKDQIAKENPGFDAKKFAYRLNRTEYERDFGKQYLHPGVGTRLFAFVVEHLPKIGPLKALKLSIPNPDQQKIYIASINTTVDHYKVYLAAVKPPVAVIPGLSPAPYPKAPARPLPLPVLEAAKEDAPEPPAAAPTTPATTAPADAPAPAVATTAVPPAVAPPIPDPSLTVPDPTLTGTPRAPDLAEIDLDTGKPSRFGEYHLADVTYARLLNDLLHSNPPHLTPDVQQSFVDFYDGPRTEPAWYRKKPKDWLELRGNLDLLDSMPKQTPPPPAPTGVPAPSDSQSR